MQYKQAFLEWESKIASVPLEESKTPKIPVKTICAEAEELAFTCKQDKEQLISVGLNWQLVDDLKPLSNALRYCQAIWVSTPSKSEAETQWLALKKEALALKKELLRHFNYAFFHHPELKKKLQPIRKNHLNRQLSYDLLLLAKIAQNNALLLASINYDTHQNLKASQLAEQLKEVLAAKNTTIDPKSKNKLLRDQVYTLLSARVKEIRICGRYLFHEDKTKQSRYVSKYYKGHKKYRQE